MFVTHGGFCFCLYLSILGDSATATAPDSVRQWLRLIGDENSLSSQDLLYSSDTNSCADTSTASRNTLQTPDEVEPVITADCLKESAKGSAAEDKNLTECLRDGIQQYTLSHSVYTELGSGNCINILLLLSALQTTLVHVIRTVYLPKCSRLQLSVHV